MILLSLFIGFVFVFALVVFCVTIIHAAFLVSAKIMDAVRGITQKNIIHILAAVFCLVLVEMVIEFSTSKL